MHVRFEGRSPALRLSLTVDAADDGQLILDASRLTWASPADLAGMAAWAAHGSSTTLLVLPEDIDAGSYLRRMDLLKVLSDGGGTATGTLVPEGRRDLQDRLIELRRIDDQASIDAFASAVFRLVDVNSGRHQAAVVHSMVGELLDNIRHARSPVGAFGAAQVYTGATSGQTGIEVAVADPGRGILASLRDNRANREIDVPEGAVDVKRALPEFPFFFPWLFDAAHLTGGALEQHQAYAGARGRGQSRPGR